MILLGLLATFLFMLAIVRSVPNNNAACSEAPDYDYEFDHPDVCGVCTEDVCVFEKCPEEEQDYEEDGEMVDMEGFSPGVRMAQEIVSSTPMDLRRHQGMTRQPEVEETQGMKVGYAGATRPAEQEIRRRVLEADGDRMYDGDTGLSVQD